MEPNRISTDRMERKFDLRAAFWKILMLLLNVGFVISSVVLISIGVSTYVTFTTMFTDMGDAFRMLSIFWMVVGVTTIIIGVFGIFVALKEHAILANLYGIAMLFAFLGAISACIADFTLISRSRHIVSDQLDAMIKDYVFNYGYDYRLKMDWVQLKFECCGNNAPSDWQRYEQSWLPNHLQPNHSSTNNSSIGTYLTPASCCLRYTNYVNVTCEQYHSTGCFEPIHQIVSASIMTIGTSGLLFSILQMLAIIVGFVYGQSVRDKTSQRYERVWNSVQEEQRNVAMPM